MHRPYVPPLPQVQVELKKGETIMTDAVLHLPASFLHEAFSNRSGVPLEHFELYYRGKRLEGDAALVSWGIGKGSTVEVKMRGRGGVQPQATHEEPSSSEVHAVETKAAVEAQSKLRSALDPSMTAEAAAAAMGKATATEKATAQTEAAVVTLKAKAAEEAKAVPAPEVVGLTMEVLAPEAVGPTTEVPAPEAVGLAAKATAARVTARAPALAVATAAEAEAKAAEELKVAEDPKAAAEGQDIEVLETLNDAAASDAAADAKSSELAQEFAEGTRVRSSSAKVSTA